MRITVIRTNRQHQLCVTNRSIGHLLERMLKDDSKFTIQKFRDVVPSMNFGYDGYKDMPTWHRVYPAAEFQKEENGNLRMKAFNGLLLLSFRNILKPEDVLLVKKQAAFLPSTLIAVTGADGRSVEILVKFSDEKGELPTDEEHAVRLYQSAYRHILPIYQSVIHAEIASQKPSIRSYFLLTLDTQPYYNPQAVALKVDEKLMLQEPTPSIPEAKSAPTDKKEKSMKGSKENIEKMMKYLNEKYDLRYNMVMKYTEYVPKDKEWIGFQAVEPRVQKSLTLEVQLAGINVSIKDVRNFLESNFIKNYNPVEEFLFTCYDNWDGKDHIRAYQQPALGRLVLHLVSSHGGAMAQPHRQTVWQQRGSPANIPTGLQQEYFLPPSDSTPAAMGLHRQSDSLGEETGVAGYEPVPTYQSG